jgi:signal peptidase II
VKKPIFIILLIILADQVLKFWIKTNMFLGQEFNVFGNWFIIHFTENNGMAFGFELAGKYGKLLLSLFRLIAVSLIGWYLAGLVKQKAAPGLIISVSLIMAGALGNIIDSTFYGILFSESHYEVATFLPPEGYATWFHGKVVDMFYFPVIQGYFPSWFPFWANEPFLFFRPVFNIADSAITTGVFSILIFQKKFFAHESQKEEIPEITNEESEVNESA